MKQVYLTSKDLETGDYEDKAVVFESLYSKSVQRNDGILIDDDDRCFRHSTTRLAAQSRKSQMWIHSACRVIVAD